MKRGAIMAAFTFCVLYVVYIGCSHAGGAGKIGSAERTVILANLGVRESSGLAPSGRRSGAFWTHNDSGNKPSLFAFDLSGRDLGEWRVEGARNLDWEDMASAKIDGKDYLLIADVGDNARKRDFCLLYVVPEPDPEEGGGSVSIERAINFHYPDGPHDCESVGVCADERKIYLVSKTLGGRATVYSIGWDSGHEAEAAEIANLSIGEATAMDFSPDGTRAVVLSYFAVHEFVRKDGEGWDKAFKRQPRVAPLLERRQWEAVAYGSDGSRIFITAEGRPAIFREVK